MPAEPAVSVQLLCGPMRIHTISNSYYSGTPEEQVQVLAVPLRQDSASENRYYRDSSKTIRLVPDENMMKAEYKTIYVHKFGKFHSLGQMSRSIFLSIFPIVIHH